MLKEVFLNIQHLKRKKKLPVGGKSQTLIFLCKRTRQQLLNQPVLQVLPVGPVTSGPADFHRCFWTKVSADCIKQHNEYLCTFLF